jgi:hypothetical protein
MLNNVTKIIDHSGYEPVKYDLVNNRWCYASYTYPVHSRECMTEYIVTCIHGGCRIRIKKGVCTIDSN